MMAQLKNRALQDQTEKPAALSPLSMQLYPAVVILRET